jgi:hypothetical protein
MMSKMSRPGAEPVQKAAVGKDPKTHHNTAVEKRQGKQPSVVSRKQAGLKGDSPVSLQPQKTKTKGCKQLCHVGDGQKCVVLHNRKVEGRSGAAQRAARARSLEAHHCTAHLKECSHCEHEAYEADSESQPKKRVRKHKPAETSLKAEVRDSGYESKDKPATLEQTAKASRRNLKRAQGEITARKTASDVEPKAKPTTKAKKGVNTQAEIILADIKANPSKFASSSSKELVKFGSPSSEFEKIATFLTAGKTAPTEQPVVRLPGMTRAIVPQRPAELELGEGSGSLLTAGKAAGKSSDDSVAAYSRLMEQSMKAEVSAAKEQVKILESQIQHVRAERDLDAKNTQELRDKLLAETEAKLAEIRLKGEENLKDTLDRVKLEQEQRDRVIREGFAIEMAKQSEKFTLQLEAERKLRADEQIARKEQFDLAREERQVARREAEKKVDRTFAKEIQWDFKEIKVWKLLKMTGSFPKTDGLLVKVRMAKERRQVMTDSEKEILSSINNVSEAASASTSVGGGFFFTVAVSANKSWSTSRKEGIDHIRSQLKENVVTMRTEGDLTGTVRKIGEFYYIAYDELSIPVSSIHVFKGMHPRVIKTIDHSRGLGSDDYHSCAKNGGFYYHRSDQVMLRYQAHLEEHSVSQSALTYEAVGAFNTYDTDPLGTIWGTDVVPALELNNDRALKQDF